MILRIADTNIIGECFIMNDVNDFITQAAIELKCSRISLYSQLVFETATNIEFVRLILQYETDLLKSIKSIEDSVNIRNAQHRVRADHELDIKHSCINKGKRVRFSFSTMETGGLGFVPDLACLIADKQHSSVNGRKLIEVIYPEFLLKFYKKYVLIE